MGDFNRIDTTANRIKQALEDTGMRQIDLARKASIDKGALNHYLKGKYEPKQDVIMRLASALGVSEMWLWGYDCKKERSEIQKKNDTLSDIVLRMRTDEVFLEAVEALHEMDADKLASFLRLIK